MKRLILVLFVLLCLATRVPAPPPLVTGDVPTAEQGTIEWYVGGLYEESETGAASRLLPASELVFGLSDRQEINFEIGGLSQGHAYGVNDAVIGTKYVLVKETEHRPGVAGSFELKLPTGDRDRGLGSGEFDYDLRLRGQKTWQWLTLIGNIGHTFVTDPTVGRKREARENVWLISTSQELELSPKLRLLSEVFWQSRDAPGEPNMLVGQIGFRCSLRDRLSFHAAIGKSLRDRNEGGPDMRAYVGLKLELGPFFGGK